MFVGQVQRSFSAVPIPKECFIHIFAYAIQKSSPDEAEKFFVQAQLVNRLFKNLLNDSQVLAALLSHRDSLPFGLIRKLAAIKNCPMRLLQSVYEQKFAESWQSSEKLEEAISFLEHLQPKERDLIEYLSLSPLKCKNYELMKKVDKRIFFYIEIEKWSSHLSQIFKLLPKLQTVTPPLHDEMGPTLMEILYKQCAHLPSLEIEDKNFNVGIVTQFNSFQSIALIGCKNLTNQDIESLFKNCKSLKGLTLSETPLICWETLNMTVPGYLHQLSLGGDNFNNQSTQYLIHQFPELSSLGLSNTANDAEAIGLVLRSGLKLNELNLSHLDARDDHFMEVSPTMRSSLKCLKLYGCSHITDEGVTLMRDCFSVLTHLDLRYCTGIKSIPGAMREMNIEVLL